MWIIFILMGFTGGLLGGMGMGGGTILVPLLSFLDLTQKQIQCINLISFIPMASIVCFINVKKRLLVKKDLFKIIVPAIVFSIIGSILALFIKGKVLKKIFGVILLALGGIQIIMLLKKKKRKNPF